MEAMKGALGACPIPITRFEEILLGHGSGGRMSADLFRDVFLPAFSNAILDRQEDQASIPLRIDPGERLAFTTDSFVVRPLFFPGGDIGKLAVHGTLNDLAMGGARPLYLSAAFIIEEGLPIADLKKVVASMREACERSGVLLVTGDTKVVDRGKGDKLFVTTSGIGVIPNERRLSISSARPGDHVLISGTIGDHGMAILSVREGLEFETELQSDTASLSPLVEVLLENVKNVRALRDPTRGGVSSTLHELAAASRLGVMLEESQLPIRSEVKAACEILGLDPLCVANEGKMIAVVAPEDSELALSAMRSHPLGRQAQKIGEVRADPAGIVSIRSLIGGERVITLLAGEQLPRIC